MSPRLPAAARGLPVAVLGIVLAMACAATAQMYITTGRDTLRGLPGMEVAVEALPPELGPRGLTTGSIKAAVEARLRGAGIEIYPTQTQNPSAAKPYLYVHVNALEIPPGALYAVAIQVQLRQTLQSPATKSNVVNAMTWDAHNLLVVPTAELGAVRQEIESYVDQFIEDWRAVH